jgi:putative membrane protein
MVKMGKTQFAAASVLSVILLGGLAACNKQQQTEAGDTTQSLAADAGSAVENAGSAVADAVTPDTPQDFATKAASANELEIESSKLALKTSKNKDILAFAKQMVADHTKAATAFKAAVGKASGVTAPAPGLAPPDQAKLDDLKTKKAGDDFDQAYVHLQKDAHKDAVNLFDSYAEHGGDPALKAFAADTLPTLQSHKDMIDKM